MPTSFFVHPLRSHALGAALVAFILAGAPDLRAQTAIPERYPAWWHDGLVPGTRIILDDAPHDTAANYAPVNLGQLKWVATRAKNYLDARLAAAGGSGIDLTRLFPPLPPAGDPARAAAIAANYAPANLGQLKAVAKPFYDRLNQAGYGVREYLGRQGYPSTWAYAQPWSVGAPVAANYAPANLGQLKLAFGFDLAGFTPSTGDGLPWVDANGNGVNDSWETQRFGNLTSVKAGDASYYLSRNQTDPQSGFTLTVTSPAEGAQL